MTQESVTLSALETRIIEQLIFYIADNKHLSEFFDFATDSTELCILDIISGLHTISKRLEHPFAGDSLHDVISNNLILTPDVEAEVHVDED